MSITDEAESRVSASSLQEFRHRSMLLTLLTTINSQGRQVTMFSPLSMVTGLETMLPIIVRVMNALAIVLVRKDDIIAITTAHGEVGPVGPPIPSHPLIDSNRDPLGTLQDLAWNEEEPEGVSGKDNAQSSASQDDAVTFIVTQNSAWLKNPAELSKGWTSNCMADYQISEPGKSSWKAMTDSNK